MPHDTPESDADWDDFIPFEGSGPAVRTLSPEESAAHRQHLIRSLQKRYARTGNARVKTVLDRLLSTPWVNADP